MRLRLTVRRNGLPDCRILWNSAGLISTLPNNNTKPTIADLLREVDGVIPLESEDWGIEDYVVEVGGFECVHYSGLESVLKEDDEVLIRHITLNDRRFCLVSGRWQISADGRRLYDGIAFGRPFLRRAARPPVRIPSMKRARISYEDERDVEPDVPNQLILQDEESNDDDDLDYHEELSAEEIADLAAEAMAVEHMDPDVARAGWLKRKRTGLGIQAVQASPSEIPRSSSFSSRLKKHKEQPTHRAVIGESPKSVRFEGDGIDTPATVLATDGSDDSEDEDFDVADDGSETSDSEANKENIAPRRLPQTTATGQLSQVDQSSTESDEPTSASDSTSSSEDDSTETGSTSTSDSSEESSDAESDSEASSVTSEPLVSHSSNKQSVVTLPEQIPPKQGKAATQRRNARRKKFRQFKRADAAKLGAQPTGEIETTTVGTAQTETSYQLPQQNEIDAVKARAAAFLHDLNTVYDGQAEGDQTMNLLEKNEPATENTVDRTIASVEGASPELSSPPQEISSKLDENDQENTEADRSAQQQEASISRKELPTSETQVDSKGEQTTPRRRKLDLSGASRMLFGSLGLRAPKTKIEADRLRDELKTKAQQLPGNMLGPIKPVLDSSVVESKPVDEEDELWADKIDLKAVECCYDGVTYSKPPFPFVQRWDPQQQYQYGNAGKRGGRSKRRKRNNKQYYQGDYTEEGYMQYGEHDEQQDYEDQSWNVENKIPDAQTGAENVEETNSDTHAANDQLLGEMQADAHPDLPELPTDMSALDTLATDNAIPGCIIAFKQMEMSEHTQWCPVISEYKTAKILAVLDSGVLEVQLATRDTPHKEKNYDPQTGQRIYSKFEMPIDEDEEGDECHLQIGLQDMIEPKLVKAVETSSSETKSSSIMDTAVDGLRSVLAAGKEVIPAMNTAIEQADSVKEIISIEVDVNLPSIKFEPTPRLNYSYGTQEPTPGADLSLAENEAPRFASVELGSQNPPQRFFSEPQSGLPSSATDDKMMPSPSPAEENDYIAPTNKEPDTSNATLRYDDPSIWGPSTAGNEESSSHYYSLDADQGEQSSVTPQKDTNNKRNGKDAVSTVNGFEDAHRLSSQPERKDSPLLSNALLDDEDIEAPLFVDDGDEKLQPVQHSRDSADNESKESTFLHEDSPSKGEPHTSNDSIGITDGVNSDTDANSVESLRGLMSQPVPSSFNPTQVKSKKAKKKKYSKVSSIVQEDPESFIFSQAPNRLISDTHKMAVDLEDDSFLGSSDTEVPAEPYELEAHVTDTGANELEDNEPQLPAISKQDGSFRTTRRNRFASPVFHKPSTSHRLDSPKSHAVGATVVDLTLSSDTAEPDDEVPQSSWAAVNSTPRGSGTTGKIGGSLRAKPKAEPKNSKRSFRRTKSLV